MPVANALKEREIFFKPVSLYDLWFCVDDRGSDLLEPYIKVPGGLAFFASIMACGDYLRGVPIEKIKDNVAKLHQEARKLGLKIGIHFDDKHQSNSDTVGCGYIGHRQGIMTASSTKQEVIAATTSSLMPNLDNINLNLALDTYGQLGESGLYTKVTPKQVVDTAINAKAPTMTVKGNHYPDSIGIINLRTGTTFDNNEAIKSGLTAYVYDHWAFMQAADLMPSLASEDRDLRESLAIVNAITTFLILNISPDNIHVRN